MLAPEPLPLQMPARFTTEEAEDLWATANGGLDTPTATPTTTPLGGLETPRGVETPSITSCTPHTKEAFTFDDYFAMANPESVIHECGSFEGVFNSQGAKDESCDAGETQQQQIESEEEQYSAYDAPPPQQPTKRCRFDAAARSFENLIKSDMELATNITSVPFSVSVPVAPPATTNNVCAAAIAAEPRRAGRKRKRKRTTKKKNGREGERSDKPLSAKAKREERLRRNRESANRSRARKRAELGTLKRAVVELQNETAEQAAHIDRLEAENKALREQLGQLRDVTGSPCSVSKSPSIVVMARELSLGIAARVA